jgi:putative transposase
MFVSIRGEPYRLWREVDEHGAELDIPVQQRRDKAVANRFFKRVLCSSPLPRKIITDQLRSYPAATVKIPALANVEHVFVKAAARLNDRAENSHQPTREREGRICHRDFLRGVRGFRDPKRTQKFLSCFGPATLRAEATFTSRFPLSQSTRGPVLCMARVHRTCPKFVYLFLIPVTSAVGPPHPR